MKILLCFLCLLVTASGRAANQPEDEHVNTIALHINQLSTSSLQNTYCMKQQVESQSRKYVRKQEIDITPIAIKTSQEEKRKIAYPVLWSFVIFSLLLLMPFLPGIIELHNPKDNLPLSIKMDYVKNPRYFDRSFKNILHNALKKAGYESGVKQVKLSKKETVEISDEKTLHAGEKANNILYVKKDFISKKGVNLKKEIYVKGNAIIGEENILRAIACEGDITLSSKTRLIRWAGAEGNIKIHTQCVLGKRCSCDGELEIARDCSFKCLYGKSVVTYAVHDSGKGAESRQKNPKENTTPVPEQEIKNIEDIAWHSTKEFESIPPFTKIDKDFVIKKNFTVNEGCTLTGNIKSYGDIILKKDVTVNGSIFAEGSIAIGENCTVTENVFSQNKILLSKGVRIGKKDGVKSVIGKKGVELGGNVIIFGYVLTEGEGKIQ